jgi:hypothetical protein
MVPGGVGVAKMHADVIFAGKGLVIGMQFESAVTFEAESSCLSSENAANAPNAAPPITLPSAIHFNFFPDEGEFCAIAAVGARAINKARATGFINLDSFISRVLLGPSFYFSLCRKGNLPILNFTLSP